MVINKERVLISESNQRYEISAISNIGGRKDQQDSFGYVLRDDAVMGVLCDGMGGYDGGQMSGILAAEALTERFEASSSEQEDKELLAEAIQEANRRIQVVKQKNPDLLQGGSTAVAVILRGDQMHWTSVGDSRGYLIRGREVVQFTQDQNYRKVLSEKLMMGLIDEAEYEKENARGDILISYLGIDSLKLTDFNKQAVTLLDGDMILIVSDGAYRWLSEDEMVELIYQYTDKKEALEAMNTVVDEKATKAGKRRDNMTAVLMQYREEKNK